MYPAIHQHIKRWSIIKTSTTNRPPIDHQIVSASTILIYDYQKIKNIAQKYYWAIFFNNVLPRFVQRLAKLLPNGWQNYWLTFGKTIVWRLTKVFSTFDKSIIQRLIRVLSNVWQECYPTFDKSVIQRLTRVLSNVREEYYPTFDKNIIKVWKSVDKHQQPQLDIDTMPT